MTALTDYCTLNYSRNVSIKINIGVITDKKKIEYVYSLGRLGFNLVTQSSTYLTHFHGHLIYWWLRYIK